MTLCCSSYYSTTQNGPYAKLFNFKGAGGPMFKTCQCAPSSLNLHVKVDFPHRLCINKLQITHAWVTIEMYGE